MLHGSSLAPIDLNMLEDIPHNCLMVKDLVRDVTVDLVMNGLPSLHLTHWLLRDVCCIDKGSLPQSVKQL